jgi:5-methylcytosine-specific restriction endonuclease McrA
LGYPPRKKDDTSIGDAVNWEWIIACAVSSGKSIILVSRDNDFGLQYDRGSYLNDWLRQEFRERVARSRKIVLTDRLSEAFNLVAINVSDAAKDEERELITLSALRSRQAALRHAVLVRDNYTCTLCDNNMGAMAVVHVVPSSMGGETTIDNMRTICVDCHARPGSE